MNISHNTTLIAILAIAAIGLTSATVIATQIISQDLVIEAGAGDPGNLILNDGRFGIGATPGTNQLIFANGKDGIPASFRVDGVNAGAVFSLRATGGQPVFQWIDDDLSPPTTFQARIAQPDTGDFQIIDATTLPAVGYISATNSSVPMCVAPAVPSVCVGRHSLRKAASVLPKHPHYQPRTLLCR